MMPELVPPLAYELQSVEKHCQSLHYYTGTQNTVLAVR